MVFHQNTETNVVTKVVSPSCDKLETIDEASNKSVVGKLHLEQNTDLISAITSTNTRRRSSGALSLATKRNDSLKAIRRRFSDPDGKQLAK